MISLRKKNHYLRLTEIKPLLEIPQAITLLEVVSKPYTTKFGPISRQLLR